MQLIIAENENYFNNRIGGISSYIKSILITAKRLDINCNCIGSGFYGIEEDGNIRYKSVSQGIISNAFFFVKLFFTSIGIVQETKQIFHLHHPYMIFPFLKYLHQSKYILTLHSKQDISFKSKRNKLSALFYNFITRKSLRYYNQIIAVNQEVMDYYHIKFDLDLSLATIISTPVDLNVFKPLNRIALRSKNNLSESDKLILFAGRIEKEKNIDLLIKSYQLLITNLENIKLWIVGGGSELKRIQDYTIQLGLLNVSFIDTVSKRDLADLMNCADVFALTSLHEGAPIVIKEALACNLAVVSVDVGDVAKLIDGLDGCFISETNEIDFADSLKNALELGSNSNYRGSVLKYGIDEFGERLMSVYNKFENS